MHIFHILGKILYFFGKIMQNISNEKVQEVSKMSKKISGGAEIGRSAVSQSTWVQTERSAHEAWAMLIKKKPRAAMLMHQFVALMGPRNAVVISQKTLAKLLGVTDRTIRTAIADLVSERWISVVKMNGPGTVSAYVVNSQVAWAEKRENLRYAVFSATVVADSEDQDSTMLGASELRQIPTLYPGERQLPIGSGEDPPSQPSLGGWEPELPNLKGQNS